MNSPGVRNAAWNNRFNPTAVWGIRNACQPIKFCTDTDGWSQHIFPWGTNSPSTMATNNDKIQFRGEAEKEATQIVDGMRLGGINISELARQGLREKLQEALSDEEKIMIHQRYKQGELSDEVAEILLGDAIEEIEREREAFEEASELDRTELFQQ